MAFVQLVHQEQQKMDSKHFLFLASFYWGEKGRQDGEAKRGRETYLILTTEKKEKIKTEQESKEMRETTKEWEKSTPH